MMRLFLKLLLFFICNFTFAQNYNEIKLKSIELLNKGKFQESLALLNQIKDKEILETTTINLYKNHLNNILQNKFVKKLYIQDSVYKVYVKTNFLKAQGLYDFKNKKYVLNPIYDSIVAYEKSKMDYYNVYRNDSLALFDKAGKIIVPFSKYGRINVMKNHIFINKNTSDNYSNKFPDKILNLNGEIILDNLYINNYYDSQIPNYIIHQKADNKLQIIDLETKRIIKDSLTFFSDATHAFHNNEIATIDTEAQLQQFTLIESEKENILCYNVNNAFVRNKEFDTYVYSLKKNNGYIENELSSLINYKKNITLNENQYGDTDLYIVVKKGLKFGIYNATRSKFYKEPIYDSISPIGNTFYNNKWINLVYEKEVFKTYYDSYKAIIYKENNKFGLMNFYGKIITNPIYDEIKKGPFWDVFILRKKEKWGFINLIETPVIVEPKYDYLVVNKKVQKHFDAFLNSRVTVIDLKGNKVDLNESIAKFTKNYKSFDDHFSYTNDLETNRLLFEKNELYGLDDLNFKEIVPAKYKSISLFKNNTYLVKTDTLYGLIDENGIELIPIKYKNIDNVYFYNLNYLLVKDFENKIALFNYKGNQLYPFIIQSLRDLKRISNTLEYAIVNEEVKHKGITYSINNQEQKFYQNALLRIENDSFQKIDLKGDFYNFGENNFLSFRGKNGLYGLYNLKTQQVIPPKFKVVFGISATKSFFARTGEFYDTFIDSLGVESALKHSFTEMRNDCYFYKEYNKIGVMNLNFEKANFAYEVVKPILEYEKNRYASSDFKEVANSYFYYNTTSQNNKMGVVNFDGKIIIPSNIYDEINFYILEKDNINISIDLKEKYKNKLIVCYKYLNGNKQVTLFSDSGKSIITFELKIDEYWKLSQYGEFIIIFNNKYSNKVLDIKSKKIIVEIESNSFFQREDGSFYSNSNLGNYEYKLDIFANDGTHLVDESYNINKERSESYFEYYKVKKNSKFGIVNGKNELKIPIIYDALIKISNKNFIAKRYNKYGVIDKENQILVDFEYDSIVEKRNVNNICYDNKYVSFLEVKKSNKKGLLNSMNLKQLIEAEYDEIYLHSYGFQAKRDSVFSFFDCNAKLYSSVVVDSIKVNPYRQFQLFKNGKEVFLNNKRELVFENPFSNPISDYDLNFCLLKNAKYYLQKDNSIIFDTPITRLQHVDVDGQNNEMSTEFLIIEDENKKFALYDENLNQILPFQFEEIRLTNTLDFIIVKENGKYGVVDFKNKKIIPNAYFELNYNIGLQIFEASNSKFKFEISPRNKILLKESK